MFWNVIKSIWSRFFKGDDKELTPVYRWLFDPLQNCNLPLEQTQFPDYQEGEITEAILGFDFGTSSTKIIIRLPGLYGGRTYAVPFQDISHEMNQFLLPTRLFVGSKGELSIINNEGSKSYRDLKINLMDIAIGNKSDEDLTIQAMTAGYFALVIQYVRRWFINKYHDRYGRYKIRWQFNLGIPSKGYDDNSMRQIFDVIAKAGWFLSLKPGIITTNLANNAVTDCMTAEFDFGLHHDAVNIVPEVAAQVAGYARSNFRREDLHILVDVGASTLDICSFILHGFEDDKYSLLTCDVENLGTYSLHKYRLKELKELKKENPDLSIKAEYENIDDLIKPTPELISLYVASTDISVDEIMQIDQSYKDLCLMTIMKTIMSLRKERYRRSPSWETGIPIFLCGGGSQLKLFQKILKLADERVQRSINSRYSLKFQMLPKPENIEKSLTDEHYFRYLSVAYGLSHDINDIGEIIPKSAIEDEEPMRRAKEVEFVSKDVV